MKDSGKLRLKTLDLLKNRKVSVKLTDIEKNTGLPVGWLKSFQKRGDVNDSGSDKIVLLYEYLSGNTLNI